MNWYDLSDPLPRQFYTLPLDVTVVTDTTNIPPEVAIVLSFQALAVSGEPQARKRGRIYLGGISESAISTSSDGTAFPMIVPAVRTAIGAAADTLKNASTTASCPWSV